MNTMLEGHERVILAALINGQELPVTADDFSSPPNRVIFESIERVEHPALFAVQDDLERRGKLAQIGGPARLIEIATMPSDEANVQYALGEVLDASRNRRAVKIGQQLQRGDIGPGEAANSLTLLGRNGESEIETDPFPEPLSEVAFHGLPGEIVRRIEPHTEADSVALLIQILTAFGNVVDRAAHAMADGSRHGANLFAVIVGETSKSRKGTSLAHVLRIFEHVDEPWKQSCIGHGLSSGEGVIWAVHDPTTKTVKNKKSGAYETEIDDAGVDDKRLFIIEGEFASVLKVMTREGNTLSPVLRCAWDGGDLRSMTKNSPARATGAHVSMIGHITRDELRRLLTETESANGFGNRFLWFAVRRSKCLPEGGRIEVENFDDLVIRLHRAIDFASTAGPVTRDDDARKLWCEVYPELSEGKPGLLGAITARAEAQVLRLSVIYALLNLSTKVRPEHLRAALAFWEYSEASAKWIFTAATGDCRSDRILMALRIAGKAGMTQTEISEGIFNRNVTSNALSDALRLLQRSGRAKCIKESTGGGPRKRWLAADRT